MKVAIISTVALAALVSGDSLRPVSTDAGDVYWQAKPSKPHPNPIIDYYPNPDYYWNTDSPDAKFSSFMSRLFPRPTATTVDTPKHTAIAYKDQPQLVTVQNRPRSSLSKQWGGPTSIDLPVRSTVTKAPVKTSATKSWRCEDHFEDCNWGDYEYQRKSRTSIVRESARSTVTEASVKVTARPTFTHIDPPDPAEISAISLLSSILKKVKTASETTTKAPVKPTILGYPPVRPINHINSILSEMAKSLSATVTASSTKEQTQTVKTTSSTPTTTRRPIGWTPPFPFLILKADGVNTLTRRDWNGTLANATGNACGTATAASTGAASASASFNASAYGNSFLVPYSSGAAQNVARTAVLAVTAILGAAMFL